VIFHPTVDKRNTEQKSHLAIDIMASEEEEARYRAMVEFIGVFPSLTGAPPTDISELGDGVAIFEALSEM